uniref:Rieske domain-containing protein n=1 Tax=Glossina pallidipes TaxID=7398 RepID=A0A1A9Z0D9_GLOPL
MFFFNFIGSFHFTGIAKLERREMCDDYEYTSPIVVGNERDVPDNGMKQFDLIDSKKVLLIKQKGQLHAVGSKCPHYGAPLESGVLSDGRIRCPWHGACFDIKTGDIENFPGLDSLLCYKVEISKSGQVGIMTRLKDVGLAKRVKDMVKRDLNDPSTFVVVGGGPAGGICVETLRQQGYAGRLVLISKEAYLPYDRVQISKTTDVKIEALQYRQQEFYDEYDIETFLNVEATKVAGAKQTITLSNGLSIQYDKMFIATGCAPIIPQVTGIDLKNVVIIRTYDDLAAISKAKDEKTKAICLGSSIITLEVAQTLIGQVESVTIVGTTDLIGNELLGDVVGERVLRLFTDNRVTVITNSDITEIFPNMNGEVEKVMLTNYKMLPCDLLIIDADVKLNTTFLERSGLKLNTDGSIDTNVYLRTSIESIYVGGDIANAPVYSIGNEFAVIRNYQIAQNHGRIAAINMIKSRSKMLRTVPFFFTKLFGKSFRFSGYGEYTDLIIEGDLENLQFVAYFINNTLKVVRVGSCGCNAVVAKFAELQSQGVSLTREDVENTEMAWTKLIKSG